MEPTNCVNCQAVVSGRYCTECGQRSDVKRINLKEGWLDFWSRVYGFDGMFPRTLKDLTLHPGLAAREFIGGNRVKHYGPVGYFFLMITVFLLVLSMLDLDFREFIAGARKAMAIEGKGSSFEREFPRLVSENLKLFVFLMIPCQAMIAKFLFFRKSDFNILEHMVLNFYVMGHLYWVSIFSAFFLKFTGILINPLFQMPVAVLYLGLAYTSFITYQPRFKSFLKGIGVYIVSYLTFILLIIVGVLTYALILTWVNPDALEIFRPVS